MGIKSAAKKVGKAIIFMKLFEEIKANKEPLEADIAKLKEIIEEWKAEAPEDKTAILASILLKRAMLKMQKQNSNRLKLNTMLKMKKFSHGLKTKLKSLKLKRKQKLKLKNNLFLNYFSSIFSFFIFNVF